MTYRLDMIRLDMICLDMICLDMTDHLGTTDHRHGKVARHRDRICRRSLLGGWSGYDGSQMDPWSRIHGVAGVVVRTREHHAAGYLGGRREASPARTMTQMSAFSGILVSSRERCRYPLPRNRRGDIC